MKQTAKKALALLLCLLLLGAIMVPVCAADEHFDQVLSVDMQRTGEVSEWGNDILLFTVVTTPAVVALYFDNGRFEPYTTDFELIGTTQDGNLIWQQTRVNGSAHPLIEICWDNADGERMVDWQWFEYPENQSALTPAPQEEQKEKNPFEKILDAIKDAFEGVVDFFLNLFK